MGNDDDRQQLIVDTLVETLSDLMDHDPDSFRRKFRKMAADPFAFYRGSPTTASGPVRTTASSSTPSETAPSPVWTLREVRYGESESVKCQLACHDLRFYVRPRLRRRCR